MTLRVRLAVALSVVVGVLVVVGILVPRAVRTAQVRQLDRQVLDAMPLANAVPPPGTDSGPGRFSEVYVARVASDGTRTVLLTSSIAPDRAPDVPESSGFRPEVEGVGSLDGGGGWRAILLRPPGGTGEQLLVAVPLDRVDATVARLQWTLLAAGAVVATVLALATWWVIRLGLRPIAEVTQVADAIAAGERDRRVEVSTGPATEAAHLANAFNVMLDERAATEARLRQFLADASHELRTPVAAIRGFTDLARSGELDDAAMRDAMRRIGQESARVATLVEDLLLLARLDQGRPLEREPVELGALLRDAVLDASATHPTRSVSLELSGDLRCVGDEGRLRQVVANLVANALVHTDADVTVRGRTEPGAVVVEVADAGPGMAPDDAAHAFDRFWVGERSRDRSRAGSGLGLAIVQAIVEAHGGHVRIDSAPGRGTSVRVVLPAAPAELPDPQETRISC